MINYISIKKIKNLGLINIKDIKNYQMTRNIKIDPYGFREYDARWLYEKDINRAGIENLGKV